MSDLTFPERTDAVRRATARFCLHMGWAPVHEMTLPNGRRADIMALRPDGGFVCIEVNLELGRWAIPHQQTLQHRRTVAPHAQVQPVTVFDAVKSGISRTHMNVAFMADHAPLKLDHAARPYQVGAR